MLPALLITACLIGADEPKTPPPLFVRPDAFKTLVNPQCSHCLDEAKRRGQELKPDDRVLVWTRGYSEGGAIPIRFFLSAHRVISDSYGVFVYDPDAGYARGFAPSYDFRFHGWRNGVMVMRYKDGTLYSCLTGVAFDGPRKGTRLTPIPTLVSDWGFWLEKYPHAVAYHMFDKYQPVALPTTATEDSLKSRGKLDPRLQENAVVLGAWAQDNPRAYPVATLEKHGIIHDKLGDGDIVVLWEPKTRSASAYRPIASPPRKYKAPEPNSAGVSPKDDGAPIIASNIAAKPRHLTLSPGPPNAAGGFVDAETKSAWDVAGRCTEGELKGWTLGWVDSVQVKWFAWSAEHPKTTIYSAPPLTKKTPPSPPLTKGGPGGVESPHAPDAKKAVKEIAGTAEFLRLLPKPFATIKAVDPAKRIVTLLLDGEKQAKEWSVEPDAEVKVAGWWGRLEQFKPGDRVWAWLKLDRKKKPVSVVMLADEPSEFYFHASLRTKSPAQPKYGQVQAQQAEQKAWLVKQWADGGLPGVLTFNHVFSGEVELMLDHEAMRWGRSLQKGDAVEIMADPPIKAVVKDAAPWRERTMVRLVVGELQASELKVGQRLALKMAPPLEAVTESEYPPDIDKPRSRGERIEWFLASTYCVCGINKDTCTGHFYTLASCNPNGCGMPNMMRAHLGKMIDGGLSDRQIMDGLVKERGPLLLRPHLAP